MTPEKNAKIKRIICPVLNIPICLPFGTIMKWHLDTPFSEMIKLLIVIQIRVFQIKEYIYRSILGQTFMSERSRPKIFSNRLNLFEIRSIFSIFDHFLIIFSPKIQDLAVNLTFK